VLLLLDIDGTLVRGAARAHQLALDTAIREVHGVEPSTPPSETAGRTDRWIIRDILSRETVHPAAVDARMDQVCAVASRLYGHLCEPSLAEHVIPGVREGLAGLATAGHRLGLVTGNLEDIARTKLARAGLGRWLAAAPGAFASDHELRDRLPALARTRAGLPGSPVGRGETVVVGDTPLDVACAHADGLRCLAVATGGFTAGELRAAGADLVVDALPAAVELLATGAAPPAPVAR
jgi:phosphoglycolate phosphatase